MNPVKLVARMSELEANIKGFGLGTTFRTQSVISKIKAASIYKKWRRYKTCKTDATLEGLIDLAGALTLNPFVLSKSGQDIQPPIGPTYGSSYDSFRQGVIDYLEDTLDIALTYMSRVSDISDEAERQGKTITYLQEPPRTYREGKSRLEHELRELIGILQDERIHDCNPYSFEIVHSYFEGYPLADLKFEEEDIWFLLGRTAFRFEPFRLDVGCGRLVRTHAIFGYLIDNLSKIEASTPEQEEILQGFIRTLDYKRKEIFFRKEARMGRKEVSFLIYELPDIVDKDQTFFNSVLGEYNRLIQPILAACAAIESSERYNDNVLDTVSDIPHAITGPLLGHAYDSPAILTRFRSPEAPLMIAVINDQLGLTYSNNLKNLGYYLYQSDLEHGPENGYPGYFLNGESFIRAVEYNGWPPDALLCDIDLGEGNWSGLDLVEHHLPDYLENKGYKQPRVIIMSFDIPADRTADFHHRERLERLQDEGLIVGYISKFDFDYNAFGRMVGAYLD